MVLRIAGLGYQKGFGGHFHNDNSIAVLRDIPGLIIACPSHGADAVEMLRECVRLAREEQRVVVFLEPIALYHQRDLHMENDGEFLCDYLPPDTEISIRDVGQFGDGTDIAIVSYANGCYLSRQAQKILLEKGIKSRVVDLRWLAPLPTQSLLYAIEPCDHVLIVDECRTTGSQSEALMALLAEHDVPSFERLAGQDCFVATGPAYAASMPSRDGIVAAATKLVRRQT
jgi:2-oxoisovalerate dehydrogenase E1 component